MLKRIVTGVALLVIVSSIALAVFHAAARAQASPPKGTDVVPVNPPLLPAPRGRPAPPAPPPGGLGYQVVTYYSEIVSGSPVKNVAACPAGKQVVGGGVRFTNLYPTSTFHIIESYPNVTRIRGRPEAYFTGWATTVVNDAPATTRVVYLDYYAICINAS